MLWEPFGMSLGGMAFMQILVVDKELVVFSLGSSNEENNKSNENIKDNDENNKTIEDLIKFTLNMNKLKKIEETSLIYNK